jgi:hypothetical protein
VVSALETALTTGAPLTLAQLATATPARIEIPSSLRDVEIGSGCAADYDGWLTGASA